MQTDGNVISLFDGTVIGRVEPWSDNPGTFDGWLEIDGKTDRLVINGANRSWAEAQVARAYMEHAATETDEERAGLLALDPAAWKAREVRLRRFSEAAEIHGDAVGRHYRSGGFA
jgi:hypothetical protein